MQALPRIVLALSALVLPLVHASAQELHCNRCSHAFGLVQIGTSKQYGIRLTNSGTKSLRINSVKIAGAAFGIGDFPLPVKLTPGAGTTLPVVFAPTAKGKITAQIIVASNALNPKLYIDVRGTGVNTASGNLTANPSSLNFGSVNVGSSSSMSVTLSAGGGPVTISSAGTDNSEFTISGLALPATIASGKTVSFSVKFTPAAGGSAVGTLTLVSDATNSPTTISLAGTGVTGGSHSTDLSWNPDADPVIGYNIYRGQTKGGPYGQINSALVASTNYTDGTVAAGSTYFYVVTAVDANDVESTYSNEVTVVIPSP